jgi:hypothetical protein
MRLRMPFRDTRRIENPHEIELLTARRGGSRDVFRAVARNAGRSQGGVPGAVPVTDAVSDVAKASARVQQSDNACFR